MNKNIICILLLVINCFVSAISQVILKKATQKEYKSFIKQYLNCRVIIAYILFFLVVVFNTIIFKYIPLIVAGPVSETLPYVLSIIFGYFFFNESITKRKIIGSGIIVLGIIIMII